MTVSGEMEDLHGKPQGHWVKQHVGDLTLIIWSTDPTQLGICAEKAAVKRHEAMDDLKLIVDNKTKIIPECHAAEIVQRALRERGLEVGIADSWVDLGVDTGVGKRVKKKLIKRSAATNKRAGRTGWIISKYQNAKAMARAG